MNQPQLPPSDIPILLNLQDVQTIFGGLGELPLKQSLGVFQKIQAQLNEALNPAGAAGQPDGADTEKSASETGSGDATAAAGQPGATPPASPPEGEAKEAAANDDATKGEGDGADSE